MTRAKNFSTPNGHAGSLGRPNGHAPASAVRSGVPQQPGLAASDDASGRSDANAAALAAAAGTAPQAFADSAPLRPNGAQPPASLHGKLSSPKNSKPGDGATPPDTMESEPPELAQIPSGTSPLAEDGPTFVDTVHQHVDLYLASARLLKSTDEKIAQRMLERLLELKFGKGPSTVADDAPPDIIVDIDSAAARDAAEGANS